MGAKIAHGHAFSLSALDQSPNGAVVENKFQPMFAAEFLRKLPRASFEHLRLQLVSLRH